MTMLLSVIVLLTLARIRFPKRPATPNLVPPLLAQLARTSPFEELSDAVSVLEAEVAPWLHVVTVEQAPSGAPHTIPALRFRDDAALAIVAERHAASVGSSAIARDRITGLAAIRIPTSPVSARRIWNSPRAGYSRYLLFTDATAAGTTLRPVFVGPLRNVPSARWQTPVWLMPRDLRVPEGSFVFTTTGELAGLVVDEPDAQAIVPGDAVVAVAERLLTTEQSPVGSLGITVQEITPSISKAAGVASGVIVAHVEADGPAASHLLPTDVIERMDDQPIANRFAWDARVSRLVAGRQVLLRVHRGGQSIDVQLTAAAPPTTVLSESAILGLTMRSRPRLGSQVTIVDAGSIAGRAGIEVGDVVMRAGHQALPTAAQVNAIFAALPSRGAMLVAIARGRHHFVVALAKP